MLEGGRDHLRVIKKKQLTDYFFKRTSWVIQMSLSMPYTEMHWDAPRVISHSNGCQLNGDWIEREASEDSVIKRAHLQTLMHCFMKPGCKWKRVKFRAQRRYHGSHHFSWNTRPVLPLIGWQVMNIATGWLSPSYHGTACGWLTIMLTTITVFNMGNG